MLKAQCVALLIRPHTKLNYGLKDQEHDGVTGSLGHHFHACVTAALAGTETELSNGQTRLDGARRGDCVLETVPARNETARRATERSDSPNQTGAFTAKVSVHFAVILL